MRYLLVFAIFILSVFTACQVASTQTTNQAKNTKASPSPAPEAKRISLSDAKAAFDAGSVLIVDTRPQAAYKAEHIKGSISMPAAEVQDRIGELPKDKQIIFYCS
jgi:3-mercaptopyruvate sulfurtransferase SseA